MGEPQVGKCKKPGPHDRHMCVYPGPLTHNPAYQATTITLARPVCEENDR